MSPTRLLVALAGLALAVQPTLAQTVVAGPSAAAAKPSAPWTLSLSFSADAGRDRFAILTLEHGRWQFQNVNWTSPNGQSALSLLLVGRRFTLSRWVEVTVLAGPWRCYEERSWNEMVLATHVTLHGRRLRLVAINYWGGPLRASGYSFDSHTQTLSGIPHLPSWLGVSALEKHTGDGLERFFLGPVFSRHRGGLTLSAYPYWDVTRHTFDMRVGVSYSRVLRRPEKE